MILERRGEGHWSFDVNKTDLKKVRLQDRHQSTDQLSSQKLVQFIFDA